MEVIILGASGHGKVVADVLMSQGVSVSGFLDDNPSLEGAMHFGLPVLGKVSDYKLHDADGLIIGIGDNEVRYQISQQIDTAVQNLWVSAVHPKAIIASSARIGAGTVIMAGAVVNPDVEIGKHVVINTGATVDHDCRIGDYAHIGPGANLAGGVHVGEKTFVGIGVTVIQYNRIGSSTVIGAGAVVTKDIPDNVVAKGVPARW